MRTLFPFLALLTLCGCHPKTTPLQGASLSVAFTVATLAPVGSFEWGLAPLQSEVVRQATLAKVQVLKGELTPEAAQEISEKLEKAHELLQQAIDTCKEDDKTGKCTGDGAAATEYAQAARKAMP